MEELENIHTPYAVILVQLCERWKRDHGGKMPCNAGEKQQFRVELKNLIRFPKQSNFDEAMAVISDCFKTEATPPEIQKILDDPRSDRIQLDDFWLFSSALK